MSKSFKATPKFFTACDNILNHSDCSAETHTFIQGISTTCRRTGFVSAKQATCVGGTYKNVVNGGVYIQHDWW